MSFEDLDLERQNSVILLLEIAKIAGGKLEKVTGLKAAIWLDQISEQARNKVDSLPHSQIESEIGCIEQHLLDEAFDLGFYLLNSVREGTHAQS